MDSIKLEEKIDSYLFETMTEEERTDFETQMSKDPSLAEEVRVQREIMNAAQKIGLRDFLKEVEAKCAEKDAEEAARNNGNVEEETSNVVKLPGKRLNLTRWVAAAACLAVMCVFGWRHYDQSATLKGLSQENIISLDISPARSSFSSIDDKLLSAYDALAKGDMTQAREMLDKAASEIDDSGKALGNSDEDNYNRKVLHTMQDYVDWMNALASMKEGKVHKAKSQLKDIAGSDSYFAEKARGVLDEL